MERSGHECGYQRDPQVHLQHRWGCGACWEDRWVKGSWDGMWKETNIATKELLPILLAVAMWGVFWQGNQVRVQCDNMAVVHIIAANSSKDATIMHLLRGLHFVSAYYNINLRAVHIPGSINICPDAISRNLLQVFFRENPQARRYPTPIPDCLWNVLVRTQLDWRSESWRGSLAASLSIASRIAQEDRTLPASPPISHSLTSPCLRTAVDSICGRLGASVVVFNCSIVPVSS